jgi:cytochrome c oxidase subunit III
MIAGICLVGVMIAMASRRAFSPAYYTPVELSGMYWHLVDVVWIFLYPLLYLVSRS